MEQLARIAGLSVAHFNRRFRQLLRLSPTKYVETLRIHQAQQLLVATDKNTSQIAVTVGFYDQSYFTKRFLKATGMTPRTYQRLFRRK